MKKSKDYTVTGNGVAHRTADSYMNDEKVIDFLKHAAKKEERRLQKIMDQHSERYPWHDDDKNS